MDPQNQAPTLTLPDGATQDGWLVTADTCDTLHKVLDALPPEHDDDFFVQISDPAEQLKFLAMVFGGQQ